MFTTPTIINMLIVLKVRIRAFFNKRLQRNVGDVAARLPIMDGRCGSKHMHEANAVRVASAVSHASFETWPSEIMVKGKLYACVFEKIGFVFVPGKREDVNVLIHGVVGWLGLRVPVTGHESWLS
jgi:hypothetical protein